MEHGVIHTPTQNLLRKEVGRWFCFPFNDQVDAIIMKADSAQNQMGDFNRIAESLEEYKEDMWKRPIGLKFKLDKEEEGVEGGSAKNKGEEEEERNGKGTREIERRKKETKEPCAKCGSNHEGDDESMIECDTCSKWYHHACVAFVDNNKARSQDDWHCQGCTDSNGVLDYAVFPAMKNGPDWWTYLNQQLPLAVKVIHSRGFLNLDDFRDALRSLHPAYFWCRRRVYRSGWAFRV